MAKMPKSKQPGKEKRQGFFAKIKLLAKFLYWFASFVLALLEIGTIIKNW